MPAIESGDAPMAPQNHLEATLSPKVSKEEAELVPTRAAVDEYNRFRAFTPSPGAYLRTRSGVLKLLSARLSACVESPGTVIATNPLLVVAFENGALELREVQPEGKKRMSGGDYANGARLRKGDRLGIV